MNWDLHALKQKKWEINQHPSPITKENSHHKGELENVKVVDRKIYSVK